MLGVPEDHLLLLQPTRAIPRKNVGGGIRLAEALGAVYWLTGPAEDGYGVELARVLAGATCELRRGLELHELTVGDAYAAADAVVLPSTWEGFGVPLLESALYRKPVAVGSFPIGDEVAGFGFRWFPADDPASQAAWLAQPVAELLEHNLALAHCHFSLDALTTRLAEVLHNAGWIT